MLNMNSQLLIEKIQKRESQIGVVGLGYVGLPLVLRLLESGFRVVGIDVDSSKISKLKSAQTYIKHIPAAKLSEALATNRWTPTSDMAQASQCDGIVICVPTPLNPHREPDISYIIDTMDALKPHLRAGQVISLESTTYPGTTEEELRPRIESRGLKIGKDIFLVFSPEREDPGNRKFSTKTIPKVVGGSTSECLKVGVELYGSIIEKVVPVSSTRAAEMTKLLENIYRAVNIGLVNELKIVADKMGVDIWEVIDAAATKPFGYTPFYPGPGLGGHCIPIDPFYLTWKAREYGIHTKFIELAGEINRSMPEWVSAKVSEALNQHQKSVKGSKVLVLGISYKKNIDDFRESPSVEILAYLKSKGAEIAYADPYVPVFTGTPEHSFDLKAVGLTPELVQSMDCVVLATDHDEFDYEMILRNSRLIVDSRGRFRSASEKVVRS
ncbi:MAG: nucleotide sugar dehydrogenase [Oligoflexia bacterium]|nr:nucleotide sugar dehydrogenase [Oligoflexia bacterium]